MSDKLPDARRALGTSAPVATVVEILKAAERVKRKTITVISPHGLTLPQFNALRILRQAPAGLSTMEVSDRLLERSPGITRIVDGLIGKSLVNRKAHPEDRRSIICKLTPRGRRLALELDVAIRKSDRELTQALTSYELKQLADLISQVGGHD